MRAILTYHSIDPSGSVVSIDAATFRRQVEFLHDRVRVLPLDALLETETDADAVSITFDDGFENFAAEAWPVLRDHGMPVTLFVVTARAGGSNDWDVDSSLSPRLPLLDWDALARLAEEGVTLGSHSHTHPRLSSLGDAQLKEELETSARTLEARTGRRPDDFAYPYGELNESVAAAVARSYLRACTTELRALGVPERPHLLPRLDMYYFRKPGTLEEWGRPSFQRRLRLRGWARSLRRRLPQGQEPAPAGPA